MRDYDSATYGDAFAEIYDAWYSTDRLDTDRCVDLLVEYGKGGRALELGVGTGRVAIPLAAAGLDVSGIDASEPMLDVLRGKPGGERVTTIVGDFAAFDVPGRYDLVYAPFTTFFLLTEQAEQVRCLAQVAEHLVPGGHFVLDAFVPDPTRFRDAQRIAVEDVGIGHAMLEVSRHDPVLQRVDSVHVVLTASGVRIFPVCLRYAWPAELDLMAQLAGLELVCRLGGYDRRPFSRFSTHHVSVYRRGPQP